MDRPSAFDPETQALWDHIKNSFHAKLSEVARDYLTHKCGWDGKADPGLSARATSNIMWAIQEYLRRGAKDRSRGFADAAAAIRKALEVIDGDHRDHFRSIMLDPEGYGCADRAVWSLNMMAGDLERTADLATRQDSNRAFASCLGRAFEDMEALSGEQAVRVAAIVLEAVQAAEQERIITADTARRLRSGISSNDERTARKQMSKARGGV